MDRRFRFVWVGGLAATLVSTSVACRSTRSEVPPNRGYSRGASQATSPLDFGSTPANPALNGMPPASGTGLLPGGSQFGTPTPGSNSYGAPTGNSFGPPGTSGMAPASPAAGFSPATTAPGGDPTIGIPQIGTGPTTPSMLPGNGQPRNP